MFFTLILGLFYHPELSQIGCWVGRNDFGEDFLHGCINVFHQNFLIMLTLNKLKSFEFICMLEGGGK